MRFLTILIRPFQCSISKIIYIFWSFSIYMFVITHFFPFFTFSHFLILSFSSFSIFYLLETYKCKRLVYARVYTNLFYHPHFFMNFYPNIRHIYVWQIWERKVGTQIKMFFYFCIPARFCQHFHMCITNERRKNFSNKNVYFLYILLFLLFSVEECRRDITTSECARASVSRKQGSKYKQYLRDCNARKLISPFLQFSCTC